MQCFKWSARLLVMALVALVSLPGCGGSADKDKDKSKPASNAAPVPAELFLTASPGAPMAIEQLKKDAKEGDEVIVRVIVGGEMKPIVEALASMTVVDVATPSCAANPDDECPTPWDYCCTAKEELIKHKATVQAVDKDGKPLKSSFAVGERIKPHDTLIVKGKVGPRPDPKVLVINASGIFIEGSLKKKG